MFFRVKDIAPGVYDLYSRHCASGTKQIKGLHFKESYTLIAVGDSIRICLAFSAEHGLTLYIIDIHNAFQNTLFNINECVYMHLPPYYLQWFKMYYPNYKLPSTKTFYILQSIHAIQGTKPAGKQWHDMIKQFFLKFGLKQNATDNAVFALTRGSDIIILLSETDDFLIMSNSHSLYSQFKTNLEKAFKITTQEGPELNYLNLHIVQSNYGISFDQTQHILDMVEPHFPRDSSFSKVNFPFCTDRGYEQELANAIPVTPAELAILEKNMVVLTFPCTANSFTSAPCRVLKSPTPCSGLENSNLAPVVNHLMV